MTIQRTITAIDRIAISDPLATIIPTKNQIELDTSDIAKILIIGETGSGKSTFINYLTNYFRNGSLNNIKIAIPSLHYPIPTETFDHHEHAIHDRMQSKTDKCNQYIFVDNKTQKQYLFLDTPGWSDARRVGQDDINMNKIIDAVESLGGLTAVIIVVNGTSARVNLSSTNFIARLRDNMPDTIMNNVIVISTNAKRHQVNYEIKSLNLHGNVYPYYMQNSAFSMNLSTRTQSAMDALKIDWDQSMDEMKLMIDTIDTFKTKSITAFKDMKDIRNEIKILMHQIRLEINKIQTMQEEIAAFEEGLKHPQTDELSYKDYAKERTVDQIDIVDAAYHSTLCQNCNFVCHNKCGLDEQTIDGSQIFQQCYAMSAGVCTKCPNECSYTAHYIAKKTVKITQKKLQDVLQDIKAKFDMATKNKADFQQKVTTVGDAKRLLEKALKQKTEDIKQKCNNLRKICSGFYLVQEFHSLIHQLEVEATMLQNIDARLQAETIIRDLKEFCKMLKKDQQTARPLPPMNIIETARIDKPLAQYQQAHAPPPPSPQQLTNQAESNINQDVISLI
ncbi:unnamed protein product [Didymodactylos carnosus]|uniref:Rad50/SbcC-type AAA domain-containing protein n=1 Tax=Didymodactylos carnosus TaxID=1234261 RepID=A0A8S2HJK7_9BILA|nr:unnamed protein product [Didymodactylos carnosus]CAF3652413.1 unnamed protein product [Didymodactylos carnosus]